MNKLNFYQFGRSLLPISFFFRMVKMSRCFSSDVYKESTQARKYHADGLQFGRSMVEMIGVLAIIGILSVGAIAGYQKAMFKYKLNKQTQQLNTIIGAITKYKSELKLNTNNVEEGHLSDTNLITILKKLGEIPKEMYISDKDDAIKDSFGINWELYHRIQVQPTYTENQIEFLGRMSFTEFGFDMCKNLYQIVKEWHQDIDWAHIVAFKGTEFASIGNTYGNDNCYGSRTCLKDLTLTKIDELCQITDERSSYNFRMGFMFN